MLSAQDAMEIVSNRSEILVLFSFSFTEVDVPWSQAVIADAYSSEPGPEGAGPDRA